MSKISSAMITVENLGKSYLVGHQSARKESYTSLRDVFARHVTNFGRKALDMALGRQIVQGDEVEEFWALQDVSFEVNRGEVIGIIGRNGAGKSTLLKILSRITEPTKGRVQLRGRIASLLEVGTGFHPELSGRENIFLNGAILGMSRFEINRKFEDIVEFAEVERFLDTPVKRYSSGMYVRLAFAVAAHLEPEILIVDEVLAVGDQQFQKKCLGKMQEVAQGGGKTVLFVSHNMGAVQSLCQKAIQLQRGRVVAIGSAAEITANFLAAPTVDHKSPGDIVRQLDPSLDLLALEVLPHLIPSGSSFKIAITLKACQPTSLHEASIIIHSQTGARVAIMDLRQAEDVCRLESAETVTYIVEASNVSLMEGLYEVGFFFRSDFATDELFALRDLTVLPGRTSCKVGPYPAQNRGFVELDYRFKIERLQMVAND